MPIDRPAVRIERFDPRRHDRAGFDCGVDRLNNYLKLSAKKQQNDDMTRVYVVVEDGSARVLGYHAISLGRMNVDDLGACGETLRRTETGEAPVRQGARREHIPDM